MLATTIIVGITFTALTLSVVLYPSIKIGCVKIGLYWIIALVGALIILCANLAPVDAVFDSFVTDSAVNPLKILALFLSMTFLSVYLDEVGFFTYLAKKAVAVSGKSQLSLFIIFYLLTAILTIFTSNDIVILTLTPFICFFCKNTKIDPLPYLVGEFAAANTYSMALIIGNPTNVYLATSAGITFVEYVKVMILPTLAAGVTEFCVILLLFKKSLKQPPEKQEVTCEIESKTDLVFGGVLLVICLVFLIISGYVNIEMWLVSVICACVLLIFAIIRRLSKAKDRRLERSLVRLPWQIIPFVLSMFVIVVAFEIQGISSVIGAFLSDKATVFTYGVASYVSANVINNIPMSMLFSTLTVNLSGTEYMRAVYASVVGSNLGAFLTPIGALAGIMFTDLVRRYDVKFGFKKFVRYGAVVGIPTLFVALSVLFLII